jgi:hypothetical protein
MILLTAAVGLAALGFLAHRIRKALRRSTAGTAAYWLDAIEGGNPIISKYPVR